jgi:7-cyano-7-deazaguanine synthase
MESDIVKTAILLSGGIDSAALAFWKHPDIAITVDYGQLAAEGEIRSATIIAEELHIEHHIIKIDCSQLGSGDMIGTPQISVSPMPEWWPYRNQFLLTVGAMKAISLNVNSLLFGSVLTDGQHVDGSATFFRGVNELMKMQEGNITVSAPAIEMTSVDLVRISKIPMNTLCWCHSCHTSKFGCGNCRGCFKYQSVMTEVDCGLR